MDKKRQQELRMLGITISYYRRAKGYTQAQLAREIHVSRTHISNIEAPNARTSVSITLLMDIADALDLPLTSLFDFHDRFSD